MVPSAQWALVSAIDEVQQAFACEGRLAGATATIVMQVPHRVLAGSGLSGLHARIVRGWPGGVGSVH